ncbi:MAG: DUF4012 domain-containing protein [Candidatus Aquicultorales bacterium]
MEQPKAKMVKVKKKVREKRFRKGFKRAVAALVALAAAGSVLHAAGEIIAVRGNFKRAQAEIGSASSLVRQGQAEKARVRLIKAQNEMSAAQMSLQSPDLRFIALMPLIGNDVRALEKMSVMGQHSVRVGIELSRLYSSISEAKRAWAVSKRLDPAIAVEAEEPLERASAEVQTALAEEREIPDILLVPAVRDARMRAAAELNGLRKQLEVGERLVEVLPSLLGAEGRREYFLAVQNNAELRATGGLIGNYGIIIADQGKLYLEKVEDIHGLQTEGLTAVEAPKEFTERRSALRSTSLWVNVNMSPDFPTSAEVVVKLFERSTGRRVDGVIAVDSIALAYLLEATGPVQMPDAATAIGPDNAVKWTLSDAYAAYEANSERKDALKLLAKTVWGKLLEGGFEDTEALGVMLLKSVEEKHLMVYLADPAAEQAIKEIGCGGEVDTGRGDYLLVSIENFGMNKVDYYLRESIDHEVLLREDGSARMLTAVELRNGAPSSGLTEYVAGKARPGFTPGSNEAYVSIFVPDNAELRRFTLDGRAATVEIGSELGKRVYSTVVTIPPGGTSKLQLQYEVPEVLVEQDDGMKYQLTIQKQPMVLDAAYSLRVRGPGLKAATDDLRLSGDTASGEGKLTADSFLSVLFSAYK